MEQYNRSAKFAELKPYDHTAKEHDFMKYVNGITARVLTLHLVNVNSHSLGANGIVCKHWLILKDEWYE